MIEFLSRLVDHIAEILASPLGTWVMAAFVATAATFFRTAWDREAIDKALVGDTEPLELLDLSRGDALGAMDDKAPVPPERLWTYDEEYLERFGRAAARAPLRRGTALELYLKSTLRWDIAFAISLAAFVALFWFAVAGAAWAPLWLARAALLCGSMGILYGAADVAEDLKLISILRGFVPAADRDAGESVAGEERRVDPAEAMAANLLTRIKMMTIVLSIVGALVFATLSATSRIWLELSGLLQWAFELVVVWLRGLRIAGAGG
jgi:hypothetical protein